MIVDQFGDQIDVRLAQALFDGWGHLERGRTGNFTTDDEERRRQIEELSEELLATHDRSALVGLIERRLEEQLTVFGRIYGPDQLISSLAQCSHDFGVALIEHVMEEPSSALEEFVPTVLAVLFEVDGQVGTTWASRLASSHLARHRMFAAMALGMYRGRRALSGGAERELLTQLAADGDTGVRLAIAKGLGRLTDIDPSIARHILHLIPFSDSSEVAEEVVSAITSSRQIHWHEDLSQSERRHLLDQLESCPSIDGNSFGEFMSMLADTSVDDLAHLLMRRIDRAMVRSEVSLFDAIPSFWHTPFNAPRDASFTAVLYEVLEWLANESEDYSRASEGGRLFGALAGEFDETVRKVILNWAKESNEIGLRVLSRAFTDIPANAILENPRFIGDVLRAAESIGGKSLAEIAGSLEASLSTDRESFGFAGVNSRDLMLERRSLEIAKTLPERSLEHRFFLRAADSAHRRAHWFDSIETLEIDSRDWDGA
jgi:hypothetical protein